MLIPGHNQLIMRYEQSPLYILYTEEYMSSF
jgi:hypothetical protein